MEDEKDISPPDTSPSSTPDTDDHQTKRSTIPVHEEFDPSTLDYSSVPLFEELQANPPNEDIAREVIAHYSSSTARAPFLDLENTEEMDIDPIFAAPSVTQAEGGFLAREQLTEGVRVDIPRSPKLWAGDQLRLRWGKCTFCSPISEPRSRTGPRELRWLSGAILARSTNGMIQVSYEVFRRSRLVGTSENLTLMLTGELKRSAQSPRPRATRRRKRPV